MSLAEDFKELYQTRMLLQIFPVQYGRGAERKEPNHGSHSHSNAITVWHPEKVVVETVAFIPHLVMTLTDFVHGIGNPDKVLHKAVHPLFVRGIFVGQDHGYLQHRLTVESHPCGTIGLFQRASTWQRCAAIEHTDVVQPEESSRKDIPSRGVFAIHPPIEIQQ